MVCCKHSAPLIRNHFTCYTWSTRLGVSSDSKYLSASILLGSYHPLSKFSRLAFLYIYTYNKIGVGVYSHILKWCAAKSHSNQNHCCHTFSVNDRMLSLTNIVWWERKDSNLLTQRERIYSPLHLSNYAALPINYILMQLDSRLYWHTPHSPCQQSELLPILAA